MAEGRKPMLLVEAKQADTQPTAALKKFQETLSQITEVVKRLLALPATPAPENWEEWESEYLTA